METNTTPPEPGKSAPIPASPPLTVTQPAVAKPATAPAPASATTAVAKPVVPATPTAPPPPPVPVPSALAHLSLPLQGVDYTFRGIHAEAKVPAEQVVEAARQLGKEGFAIDTITGVDWMAESQMEVVYDYFHPDKCLRVAIRTRIPREKPEVPTISAVFPGANWHERETHDFFGIAFLGHPDLRPFLLPEDAEYHPLRKDFTSCS
jgi:NADH-quinone oxidoreductase subunit C